MGKRMVQGSMDVQPSEARSRTKSVSCTNRDGNGSGGDVAVEKKKKQHLEACRKEAVSERGQCRCLL